MTNFEKDQVIYDVGDENQTFFFVQKGFVKVGSVTEGGQELIDDVRKAGYIEGNKGSRGNSDSSSSALCLGAASRKYRKAVSKDWRSSLAAGLRIQPRHSALS